MLWCAVFVGGFFRDYFKKKVVSRGDFSERGQFSWGQFMNLKVTLVTQNLKYLVGTCFQKKTSRNKSITKKPSNRKQMNKVLNKIFELKYVNTKLLHFQKYKYVRILLAVFTSTY